MDQSRPRPRAHALPRLFPPRVHRDWAWLDPWWPVASQTSTATTHPPSTPRVIKASLGTATARLHAPLAGWQTYSAHTRMYRVCAHFVTHYFKHFSRTHKHSDALTKPSLHTCEIILIDSVCAARPLFCLGDAITALNAYTECTHVCERLCLYMHKRPLENTPFIVAAVYTTRQIMTVHVREQVLIVCVCW